MSLWLACSHKNYTFPQTIRDRNRNGISLPRTYVACLSCGKELPYDWEQMKVMKAKSPQRSNSQLNHEHSVAA